MHFFDFWKDSLRLCNIASVRSIVRSAIKSMGDAIRALMAPWFLIPFFLFIGFAFYWLGLAGFILATNLAILISSVLFLIAARPVHEDKNFEYFKKNVWRVFVLAFASMAMHLLLWILLRPDIFRPIFAILAFVVAIMPVYFDLAILFDLDRMDRHKAKSHAWRMVWYNYPLFVLYIVFVHIVGKIVGGLVGISLSAIQNMLPVMMILALVAFFSIVLNVFSTVFMKCLIVTLYTKRVQDQPELYQ